MALHNLCTILHLTFYDPALRKAAQDLRELIRKNTLSGKNACDFDKTEKQKALESNPIRSPEKKYAQS